MEKDLAAGRIAIAVPQPVVIDRGYYLCQPSGRATPAALQDFRLWLLAQAQPGSA
ncbi:MULTISPECIES: hypothetical protein [Acidovorax]|uniref:hypothetical protein n=1 Tax=Acidovorax TaxID=12916 RepID=UPI001FCAFE13|nr:MULTISPECIES: hypothetical protein [Acidovorax]